MSKNWNATGRVGRVLYAILDHKGCSISILHTKADADYMMKVNNGRVGRHWKVVRFVREGGRP